MTKSFSTPRRQLTRTRLLTAAGVIAVLTIVGYGSYWWAFLRLSSLERALVGDWCQEFSSPADSPEPLGRVGVVLGPDRRYYSYADLRIPGGRFVRRMNVTGSWRCEGELLVTTLDDPHPDALPWTEQLSRLSTSRREAGRVPVVSVTATELVQQGADGRVLTLTRNTAGVPPREEPAP